MNKKRKTKLAVVKNKDRRISLLGRLPMHVVANTSIDDIVHFLTQQLPFEEEGFFYMEVIGLIINGIGREITGSFSYSCKLKREIKSNEQVEHIAIHLNEEGKQLITQLYDALKKESDK